MNYICLNSATISPLFFLSNVHYGLSFSYVYLISYLLFNLSNCAFIHWKFWIHKTLFSYFFLSKWLLVRVFLKIGRVFSYVKMSSFGSKNRKGSVGYYKGEISKCGRQLNVMSRALDSSFRGSQIGVLRGASKLFELFYESHISRLSFYKC